MRLSAQDEDAENARVFALERDWWRSYARSMENDNHRGNNERRNLRVQRSTRQNLTRENVDEENTWHSYFFDDDLFLLILRSMDCPNSFLMILRCDRI